MLFIANFINRFLIKGNYSMSSILNTKLTHDIKSGIVKIQSVFVQGMTYQDSNGNTYNSVTIQVQTIDKNGKLSIDTLTKMFAKYGYGNEYLRRAKTLLQKEFDFKCDYTNTYDIVSRAKKSEIHKVKDYKDSVDAGYYTLADY